MFNYSQEKIQHRLLMQINRNEEVPRLVTIQQPSKSKDTRNKLLMQARAQTHNDKAQASGFVTTERKVAIRQQKLVTEQNIYKQQNQNADLRKNVEQMKYELQKLKQVNQGLISRLKQVQNSYRMLKGNLQRANQQQQRKIKINIYKDVEEYIKAVVQRLTINLKSQKMNLNLQKKLQIFMAQLMEINSVTVEQFIKWGSNSAGPSHTIDTVDLYEAQSKVVTNKYTTTRKSKDSLPTQQHYATIMQRLTGQARMSKSYAVTGVGYATALSRDARLRDVYATTPQKRKRIFD